MSETVQRHLKALELDKILHLLAEETACDAAAELAVNLRPATSLSQVKRLLTETDEAHTMMARFGRRPLEVSKTFRIPCAVQKRAERSIWASYCEFRWFCGLCVELWIGAVKVKASKVSSTIDLTQLCRINIWRNGSTMRFFPKRRWRTVLLHSWQRSGGKFVPLLLVQENSWKKWCVLLRRRSTYRTRSSRCVTAALLCPSKQNAE